MSMGIPAALARQLGATHVIAVTLPAAVPSVLPSNMFQVVTRCFQILQSRSEKSWRPDADLEIAPDVRGVEWNAFGCGSRLIEAGEAAAKASLGKIQDWLSTGQTRRSAEQIAA